MSYLFIFLKLTEFRRPLIKEGEFCKINLKWWCWAHSSIWKLFTCLLFKDVLHQLFKDYPALHYNAQNHHNYDKRTAHSLAMAKSCRELGVDWQVGLAWQQVPSHYHAGGAGNGLQEEVTLVSIVWHHVSSGWYLRVRWLLTWMQNQFTCVTSQRKVCARPAE